MTSVPIRALSADSRSGRCHPVRTTGVDTRRPRSRPDTRTAAPWWRSPARTARRSDTVSRTPAVSRTGRRKCRRTSPDTGTAAVRTRPPSTRPPRSTRRTRKSRTWSPRNRARTRTSCWKRAARRCSCTGRAAVLAAFPVRYQRFPAITNKMRLVIADRYGPGKRLR